MEVPNPIEDEEQLIDVGDLEYDENEGISPEEYDEKLLRIFEVALCSEMALEEVKKRWANGEYEMAPSPLYVNTLREARDVGQEFLRKYDTPETRGDLSNVDREDVVKLRGTVVEVAPHFGVDLEVAGLVDDGE
jgi:hypothetical protein